MSWTALDDSDTITKSTSILCALSIIHECSGSCKFARRQYETSIEREELCLSSTRIEYEHDYYGTIFII